MSSAEQLTVWIPVYKDHLALEELLSLWQTTKMLSAYKCVIAGKKKHRHFIQQLASNLGHAEQVLLPDRALASVRSYCNLLLSPEFYETFSTSHILVAQLDAWVCQPFDQGFLKYDYIAPRFYPHPCRSSLHETRCIGVGVGGFSLRSRDAHIVALRRGFAGHERNFRRTRLTGYSWKGKFRLYCSLVFAQVTNTLNRFPSAAPGLSALGCNEDWVLGIYCYNRMKVAPRSAALSFAIDGYFRDQLSELSPGTPFGLHGWYRDEQALDECWNLICSSLAPGWHTFLGYYGYHFKEHDSARLAEAIRARIQVTDPPSQTR